MAFETPVQESLLESVIHHGATFSNEYVLQYAKDAGEALRRKAKQQVMPLIEQMVESLKAKLMEDKAEQQENGLSLQKSSKHSNSAPEKMNK